MMRCFLARDGAPHRAALTFAAAAALAFQPLRAAGAQAAPVGQPAQEPTFARLLASSSAFVQVVQPKLLLEAPAGADRAAPELLLEPTRPVLANPDVEPTLTVNPEPSTFALLAGAGAVLGVAARRRARSRAA